MHKQGSASREAGEEDTTRSGKSPPNRKENSSASKTDYSLYFSKAVENAARAALASYVYIRQKQRISHSFSGDVVRQLYYPNSYFFLFRESTSVTNIQYAELYSLLKDGAKCNNQKIDCIIFHSTKELRKDMEALWFSSVCQLNSFSNYCRLNIKTEKTAKEKQEEVKYFKQTVKDIQAIYATAYENQTRHTILIEPFANSCCVALPPEVELDVNFIVGQSGYIHSCGEAIYIRSFQKAEVSDLVSNLKLVHGGIVDKYRTKSEKAAPVKFCIYCHEDSLSQYPRTLQAFGPPSFENIRLYRHKNFIGATPISDLAEAMNDADPEFFEKYFIISNYMTSNQGLKSYNNQFVDHERLPCTVFLVKDNSIGSNAEPTSHQYYICYLQTVKNENPFLRFDEDKPGWLSPVTTPHSLACAMINLARRALNFDQKSLIVLWDPFCATGTIPLEAAKLRDQR